MFDLAIVGGGLVGASLACALSGHGLRLALVEGRHLGGTDQPAYDDRVIALARASQAVFESLDLWPDMASEAAPIRCIHVSDRGRMGSTLLRAADSGLPAFGQVVPARAIGAALGSRLGGLDDVALYAPARLLSLQSEPEAVSLELETDSGRQHLRARLVVGADGAGSVVRGALGGDALRWEYRQSAIYCNLTPELPHDDTAYERFADDGPVAMLPLPGRRCSLVCTVAAADADALMAAPDPVFRGLVQRRFGWRLGRIGRIGRRAAQPLFLLAAQRQVGPRLAILGNAAHTLHPVAGQGFNLGLRDVAALAEEVVTAHRRGGDPGDADLLKRYSDWRRGDQQRTLGVTDGLVRLFGNPLAPVRLGRGLGLMALDMLPGVKRELARHAMGLGGRQPRLVRGQSL